MWCKLVNKKRSVKNPIFASCSSTYNLPRDKNLFLMGCFQKYIEIWHFVTKQFLILAFYIAYTGVITLKTSGNSISIFLMNEIKKMERPQSFPSSWSHSSRRWKWAWQKSLIAKRKILWSENFFFIKSTNFYLPFYVKPRVHKALKLKIKKINFWSLVIRFFLRIPFIIDNAVICTVVTGRCHWGHLWIFITK